MATPTNNYYLNARREWNERYGDHIAQARNWRMVAITASIAAVIAVAGVGYIGAQNKFVPYVVAVDKLGTPAAVGPAVQSVMPDARVVKAQLAAMISNLRTVSGDPVIGKQMVLSAYSMISQGTPAFTLLNEHFTKHSPLELAQTESVSVQITSVLPMSDKTFQIDWTESHRAASAGTLINETRWRAAATVAFNPPGDEAGILRNPLGLFVTDLQWSQQL